MESIIFELIQGIKLVFVKKKMSLIFEIVENLECVLRQVDLVKFVKFKLLEFEIIEDRNKIQKVILIFDNVILIEVFVEEED